MGKDSTDVVVAGHICLDIILRPSKSKGSRQTIFSPGKLVEIGPALTSSGGPVSNTGLALHRLGVPVRLVCKIGDDLFGKTLLDLLDNINPALTADMNVVAGENTSYSIVISPAATDRFFLHCTGANDTFRAADISSEKLSGARLLHFGYPPLMRLIYSDGGRELSSLFERAKREGLATSLDMCVPDPEADSGRVDWSAFLKRVLPQVDIFMPSLGEILFMLDRDRFERLQAGTSPEGTIDRPSMDLLGEISNRLIGCGAAVVGLKLGDQGLYLRTTGEAERLRSMGGCAPADVGSWLSREMLAPCFRAEVVGTTGAGDCTIAGFLTGLLRGLNPDETIVRATGAGACCVEKADATSGVPPWTVVEERIKAGWARRPSELRLDGWRYDGDTHTWKGPNDKTEK